MPDLKNIQDKVKATLEADSFIGNTSNIKIIEVNKRAETDASGNYFGFDRLNELPSITVEVVSIENENDTTRELLQTVSVDCVLVTYNEHPQFQDAMDAHLIILKELMRVLNEQRTSAADFSGLDGLTESVDFENDEPIEDPETDYWILRTICNVQIILTETF